MPHSMTTTAYTGQLSRTLRDTSACRQRSSTVATAAPELRRDAQAVGSNLSHDRHPFIHLATDTPGTIPTPRS
jgi:hypothetical protein